MDFESLYKERRPQGKDSGISGLNSNMERLDDDISIISVDLQFYSNLRLGLVHNDATNAPAMNLVLGDHPDCKTSIETHIITFERYNKLPIELRIKKEKILKAIEKDPTKL